MTDLSRHLVIRLPEGEWRERMARYASRLTPFVQDRIDRMSRGEKHPARDFLFEYYSFRPSELLRWSPGPGVLLEGATPAELGWRKCFVRHPDGMILAPFPGARAKFVAWATQYLEAIVDRDPLYGCFGLHEWAMVYRTPEVRHAKTPLRLLPEAISRVVDGEHLCCTHYDAFRFFTPEAVPRNRHALSREITTDFDQRACIHVNMDLYRYAYKIAPWVPGELLADCFDLAWEARQIDMRASPYDMRPYGLEPIFIETDAGKLEYVAEQKRIAGRAVPLRQKLLEVYRGLRSELQVPAEIG
jgi:hypothetical protein